MSYRPITPVPACPESTSVRARPRPGRPAPRRAMLLVVVLVIISVLGLLAASFSYRMNADFASVKASQDQQQALLAARTGIEVAIELLRAGRTDMANWYNNYQRFRRIPVFIPADREGEEGKGGSVSIADQDKIPGRDVWRFSLVGYERSDKQTDRVKIRYGLTDEASKVNLNTASRSQLLALFDAVKHDGLSSEELADALIDWRDGDDEESPRGAESSYYLTLKPAYRAKNAPLASVEELLMIRGFNGRILYGEDYNRNGYLDANEDDGEENGAFPPDDADGQLNQGLLPYVTVYSWDWNRSNDNKQRVDINTIKFSQAATGADPGALPGGPNGGGLGGLAALAQKVPKHITDELRPEVIDFIAEAQKRGYRFKSVGDLLGLEVYEDGSSNHDSMWNRYGRQFRQAEARVENTNPDQESGQGDDEEEEGDNQNQDRDESGGGNDNRRPRDNDRQGQGNNNPQGRDDEEDDEDDQNKDTQRRRQSIRTDSSDSGSNANRQDNRPPNRGGGRNNNAQGSGEDDGRAGGPEGRAPSQNDRRRDRQGQRGEDREDRGRGDRGRPGNRDGAGQNNNQGAGGGRNRGTPVVSPVEAEDLPALMDRLSVWNSPVVAGLINVNTAPAAVLRTIPGLEEEEVESIVDKRTGVQDAEKLTAAWLATTGALTPEKFALISNLVTTRSIQFTIDAIGFADHVGSVKRIQAVVEMRGELAQLKYYRDITSLGIGFPVWEDQRSDGFAFSDR